MTVTSWNEVPLKEVCELIVDCVNKTAPVVNYPTPYKMIRTTNVKNGVIDIDTVRYVEKDTFEKWTRRSVPQYGDVILTREAPLGEVGMMPKESNNIFLGQRLMQYRANKQKLDPYFLLYSLQADFMRGQIKAAGSGATVEHMRVGDAENILIRLPDIKTQKQVGATLSAYDDLIENNQRRIKILEEMARKLYREWFVYFRYPGHENQKLVNSPLGMVPEGWGGTPFEHLLSSMTGGDWGSEEPQGRDTSEVIVVRGTDFDEVAYGGQLRSPVRYIKPSSLASRGLKEGDVIIENSINAKSRSVGTTLLVDSNVLNRLGHDAIAASFCKVLRLHEPQLSPLVHLHARNLRESGRMEYYQNVATNGIANFQAQKFAKEEHLIMPNDDGMKMRLIDPIASIFREVGVISSQLSNLRQTRDLLLPRLLSGQVEVSKA
jgi:type I restriction enzyme S subunit